MTGNDLRNVDTHFRFGENWAAFAPTVDDARIQQAVGDLGRLLLPGELAGKTMLDIGSGSGLSALAALHSGCAAVTAIDLDPQSASTTQALLTRHAADKQWSVQVASVFDLDPEKVGLFDVVHSWGVLHHTGAMWAAVEHAASLVRPGGLLVLALYARTPACGFWRWEKRIYSRAPGWLQATIRRVFKSVYLLGLLATGRNPSRYIAEYSRARGMDWHHDVHDWLGGYPYESAAPEAVHAHMSSLGFAMRREFLRQAVMAGLLGVPCNEFVAEKIGT